MTTAYVPTSYAPTSASNGAAGATTPESQRNAALQIQQSPSASNPYAEAVTHTLNWMQYQLPPQGPAQTTGAPQALLGGSPVAPYGANARGQAPTPQTPGGTPPPPGGAPPPPAPGTTPPTTPPGTAPPPTGGYVGSAQGGRGRGGLGNDRPNTQTNTPDAWIVLKANEAAKTPGFEWLQQDPWAWQAYAAEMQRAKESGKPDTPTFAEWAVRNWGAIEQH